MCVYIYIKAWCPGLPFSLGPGPSSSHPSLDERKLQLVRGAKAVGWSRPSEPSVVPTLGITLVKASVFYLSSSRKDSLKRGDPFLLRLSAVDCRH